MTGLGPNDSVSLGDGRLRSLLYKSSVTSRLYSHNLVVIPALLYLNVLEQDALGWRWKATNFVLKHPHLIE